MSDSVIYLENIDGGSLTVGNEGRFTFRTGGDSVDIVFPLEVMPKIAALLLIVAADGQKERDPQSTVSGFPAESIEVKEGGSGWRVLEFGHARGVIPVALDSGQISELKQLLG